MAIYAIFLVLEAIIILQTLQFVDLSRFLKSPRQKTSIFRNLGIEWLSMT